VIFIANEEYTLLDTHDAGDDYYDVWGDGTYIYVACWTSGIRAYSFDGTNLALLDTQAGGVIHRAVWGDGTYIYVADMVSGIFAYSFNGTSFTLLDSLDNGGSYRNVWGDGTYIYVATWTTGIRAYSFNGSSFSLLDTQYDGAGEYLDVWCDGTYIYAACSTDGIRAYSFNGSSFTLLDTHDAGDSYLTVCGDSTYIYVGTNSKGIHAYSFDGSSFSLLDSDDSSGTYTGVWSDGTYIHVALYEGFLRAYSFNGSSLTVLDLDGAGARTYVDVWGDGTYLYVASENQGIRAYIFEVNQPPDTPTSDEISPHVTSSCIYLIWLFDAAMASAIAGNIGLTTGQSIYYKSNLVDSWSEYIYNVSADVSVANGTYLKVQPDAIVNTYISNITTLDVYVTDPDADAMTVSFYWSDDTLIKQIAGVASGSVVKTDALSLAYGTSYNYYILINDGVNPSVRVNKSFTTMLEPVLYVWGLNPGLMAKMMDVM